MTLLSEDFLRPSKSVQMILPEYQGLVTSNKSRKPETTRDKVSSLEKIKMVRDKKMSI